MGLQQVVTTSPDSETEILSLHCFGSTDQARGSLLAIPDDALDQSSAVRDRQPSEENQHRLVETRYQFIQGELPIAAVLPGRISVPKDSLPSSLKIRLDQAASCLGTLVKKEKLKRLSILAYGEGCLLALEFAVKNPEMVRRVMLVNPSFARTLSVKDRLVAFIERVFPMGLPYFSKSHSYTPCPHIHRLRCPVWQIGGDNSRQNGELYRRIPNLIVRDFRHAVDAPNGVASAEFITLLREFLEVPTKRSQKGLGTE